MRRADPWGLGNEILYSLCRRYPEHTNADAVPAKLWLIGRAYAAPLERGNLAKEIPRHEASYTRHAVPQIMASPIDQWLAQLRGIDLVWESLPSILLAHWCLTKLFLAISGRAQRSLASKYLHFHHPTLFFLFDQRAAVAVRKHGGSARPRLAGATGAMDPEYGLFVRRCMELREGLAQGEDRLRGPRAMDQYLLGY